MKYSKGFTNGAILIAIVVLLVGGLILLNKKDSVIPSTQNEIIEDEIEVSQNNQESTLISKSTSKQELTTFTPIQMVFNNINGSGYIAECTYNGQMVYKAAQNAYDGGTMIFDSNGVFMGPSGYMPVPPSNYIDEGNLQNCTDVYVSNYNIWGKTPVNIYNL